MTTVNVHEAKTNLSKLLAQVEAGEEVIYCPEWEAGGSVGEMQAEGEADT